MEYIIQDKKLIWDFDKTESNAAKLRTNNLFIEGIWSMKDTVGYDDVCVAVCMVSEDTFYYVTFQGLAFTMRLVGDNVECIKKEITK